MKKILIIEDDKKTLDLYDDAFVAEGWDVKLFTDSNFTSAEVNEYGPDLVVLDIMLPGERNGFDILEDLKRDEDLKNIPVLVLTNLESEQKVASKIGAEDYIVKANTSIKDIVNKVKGYLQL